VVEESTAYIILFDGTPMTTVQLPAIRKDDVFSYLVMAAGDVVLIVGPSCDQVYSLDLQGTLTTLIDRETPANLRPTLRGTAERFWCAGSTLSLYEGPPPVTSVQDIDVVATTFCEQGDMLYGVRNRTGYPMFRADTESGVVEEVPDIENPEWLACTT